MLLGGQEMQLTTIVRDNGRGLSRGTLELLEDGSLKQQVSVINTSSSRSHIIKGVSLEILDG